jgi:hypothetical protein
LRQLVGRAADADGSACRSAASTPNCDSYTADADDCTERHFSHSRSSGSKREHSADESKPDAADESDWTADADYHQGGRGGNRERSSADRQRRGPDSDWGSADSDAADSCTGQWSARESRAASCSRRAMRDRLGRDSGE